MAIDGAIRAAAAGTGGTLLVEGPAGIGKTGLASGDGAGARRRDARARRACGRARGGLLQAVVRQLFEALVAGRARSRAMLLTGAAALAAPALGLEPGNGDEASFAALHGLFWLTINLTRAGPALIAVDGLQWADPPSLRFLSYLAPRLDGVPVLLVGDGARRRNADRARRAPAAPRRAEPRGSEPHRGAQRARRRRRRRALPRLPRDDGRQPVPAPRAGAAPCAIPGWAPARTRSAARAR